MPDLTNPKFNELIPAEGAEISKEDSENDLIPSEYLPESKTSLVLQALDEKNSATFGDDLVVSRLWRHEENKEGEFFRVESTLTEKVVELSFSEMAGIKNAAELRTLLEI